MKTSKHDDNDDVVGWGLASDTEKLEARVQCLVILHICAKNDKIWIHTPLHIIFYTVPFLLNGYSFGAGMEQLEQVYKVMDSALEQYRSDKSDLNFGRAQGAAKLALELSIITADQFVVYMESLIWERNNA